MWRVVIKSAYVAIAVLAASSVAADAANAWKPPRTVHGQPDLQGTWTNATLTQLERPPNFGDRLVLSKEEARRMEEAAAATRERANAPSDLSVTDDKAINWCGPGVSNVDCGYNQFWLESGTEVMTIKGEPRSSIIVEPKNGRVPPLTAQAQARLAASMGRYRDRIGPTDHPEMRPLGERCLMSFGSSAGPPMLPSLYNNNYQIVQGKDAVVILVEMVHDARVIRLNAQHRPGKVKQWMGDSVGRWEGDTLVVETINFHRSQVFRGASENLKVIERFTRVAPDQILYEFTIEDPTTFTQPWTGQLAMNASSEPVYEYACHEGNYALPGILAGARQKEAEEGAKAQMATDN